MRSGGSRVPSPSKYGGEVKDDYDQKEGSGLVLREQVRTFLETTKEDRLESLYVLAVSAGTRRGELQGLIWEDADLDTGTLQVRRTMSEPRRAGIFSRSPRAAKAGAYGSSARLRRPSEGIVSAS